MKIILLNGKKKIKVNVKKVSFFGKFFGLMFRGRDTTSLLFEFSKNVNISIHSLFVFFPFLAVWLDDKNRIIEKRIVKPFIFSAKPSKKFRKLVEIPLNNENKRIIHFLVGKKRFK
ncbi:MAG: hypothetical protein AABW82_01860 [Nanoarchaeota archaeon]